MRCIISYGSPAVVSVRGRIENTERDTPAGASGEGTIPVQNTVILGRNQSLAFQHANADVTDRE